jgi:hypothetical protein
VIKAILVLSVMMGVATAFGQVAPSTRGGDAAVWIGGEFSSFDSDYDNSSRIVGPGVYGDLNLTHKLGIEGEARWMRWNAYGNQTQSDYLGGVRYRIWKIQKLSLYAKFLVGGVWIRYPLGIGTGSYFAYAPGGIGEYRLTPRLSVRGEYEYQLLPSAPGFPGLPNNGLTPNGFSVGVSYRVLGH